jgi:hypothetical protein
VQPVIQFSEPLPFAWGILEHVVTPAVFNSQMAGQAEVHFDLGPLKQMDPSIRWDDELRPSLHLLTKS